jgi:hypothetical protein
LHGTRCVETLAKAWGYPYRLINLSVEKEQEMKSKSFTTLAGQCAILAGLFGFLYSVSFVILKNDVLNAVFLLLGALFGVVVMTALHEHLREADSSYTLLAFLFSAGALVGTLIHGGYDLSNALHPPASLNADLPNPIDPRGLLTFGVSGIGLFIFSWLMSKGGVFPKNLSLLGYVSAILMLVLYLGRLIVLQATSLVIVIPAVLEGFLVNPIWYIWLGSVFLRKAKG